MVRERSQKGNFGIGAVKMGCNWMGGILGEIKLMEVLYCRRITMYIVVERFFILAAVKVHCMIIRLDKLQIIVHANRTALLLVKYLKMCNRL
jgi:hypothetical protein